MYFLDDNLTDQGYIYICIVITLLLEGLTFAYIHNFKGLQAHPMKMYMWINLATFCFMWSKLALPFICNLNLPQILSFSTPTVILNEWQAMSVLLYSTLFMDTYFYNMMIAMNMCLQFDLVFTFRRPFEKPESRYHKYFAFATILPLIPAFIHGSFINNRGNSVLYKYVTCVIFASYLMTTIWSASYAVFYLRRPGMSRTARKMIVTRHLSYIIVNVICQIYIITSEIELITTEDTIEPSWWSLVLAVLFFGQGFFLNIVLLAEPTYLPTLAHYTKELFLRSF